MSFSDLLARAGLSNRTHAAEFLGVTRRTLQRWITGEAPSHVVMLLACMVKLKLTPAGMAEMAPHRRDRPARAPARSSKGSVPT